MNDSLRRKSYSNINENDEKEKHFVVSKPKVNGFFRKGVTDDPNFIIKLESTKKEINLTNHTDNTKDIKTLKANLHLNDKNSNKEKEFRKTSFTNSNHLKLDYFSLKSSYNDNDLIDNLIKKVLSLSISKNNRLDNLYNKNNLLPFIYFMKIINKLTREDKTTYLNTYIDNLINNTCLVSEISKAFNIEDYFEAALENYITFYFYVILLQEINSFFHFIFQHFEMNKKMLPINEFQEILEFIKGSEYTNMINTSMLKLFDSYKSNNLCEYYNSPDYREEINEIIKDNNRYEDLKNTDYLELISVMLKEAKVLKKAKNQKHKEEKIVIKENVKKILSDYKLDIDFYSKSILMDYEEFNKPSFMVIDSHKLNGSYESWDRYFNTLFYLVREDFYRSLKICYLEAKKILSPLKSKYEVNDQIEKLRSKLTDAFFYINAEVLKLSINNQGIALLLKFQLPNLRKKLSNDKLKNGNLIMLIAYDFKDQILLKITKNNDDIMKEKISLLDTTFFFCEAIIIKEEIENNESILKILSNYSSLKFIMIEPKSLFDPCYHLMHRIKNIHLKYNNDNQNFFLPFKNIIIDADYRPTDNDILLTSNENSKVIENNNNKGCHIKNNFYNVPDTIDIDEEYNYNCNMFNLTDIDSFNTAFSFLDESQIRALYYALTNKIALIQGPPGTGKTKVGSVLTDLLLNTFHNKQILIVCYTNHALDSFLNHITKFETNIVRIGGKCEDENIQKYLINNSRKYIPNNIMQEKIDNLKKETPLFSINYAPHSKLEFTYMKEHYKNLTDTIIDGMVDNLSKLIESSIKSFFIKYAILVEEDYEYISHDILFLETIYTCVLEKLFNASDENHTKSSKTMFDLLFYENDKLEKVILDLYKPLFPILNFCHYYDNSVDSYNKFFVNLFSLINNRMFVFNNINLYREIGRKKNFYNEYELHTLKEFVRKILKEIKKKDSNSLFSIYKENFNNIIDTDYSIYIPNIEYNNINVCLNSHDIFANFEKEISRIRINNNQSYEKVETDKQNEDEENEEEESMFEDEKKEEIENIKALENNLLHENFIMDDNIKQLLLNPKFKLNKTKHIKNMTIEEIQIEVDKLLKKESNIWKLTMDERNKLTIYYKRLILNEIQPSFIKDIRTLNNCIISKNNYLNEIDYEIIKDKKIIAMTTSGLLKNSHLLEKLEIETVIIEEAAEVFESHVAALLTNHTKHLIMIGDHKQLRPKPNNLDIKRDNHYDVSMFERLIMNGYPYKSLSYQRRMKPEFADYVRLIYDQDQVKYIDHESILDKPKALGMEKDMLFFNHNYPEQEDEFSSSKSNKDEAEIIAIFVKYLIDQNIETNNIIILSPYIKQVLNLRKLLYQNKISVRVSSIDNYQGEECEYVVLSLVRSNNINEIGFLKIINRICVSFSRAKLGFFIFGNFDCILDSEEKLQLRYKNKSIKDNVLFNQSIDMWTKIITLAKSKNSFVNSFKLVCQTHNKITEIIDYKELSNTINGGCNNKCLKRLDCGHICEELCHNYSHFDTECLKDCKKILKCGHTCNLTCNKECVCHLKVSKTLQCGHEYRDYCYIVNDSNKLIDCKSKCEKINACGHLCSKYCYEDCRANPKCLNTKNILLSCGHTFASCESNPNFRYNKCKAKCDKILDCGHKCEGNCSSCFQGNIHLPCKKPCEKRLFNKQCKNYCGYACCFDVTEYKCEHETPFNILSTIENKYSIINPDQNIFMRSKISKLLYCEKQLRQKCAPHKVNNSLKCYEIGNYCEGKCEEYSCYGVCGENCVYVTDKKTRIILIRTFSRKFENKKNQYFKLKCKHYTQRTQLNEMLNKCISNNDYPKCLRCEEYCLPENSLIYRNITKKFNFTYCYMVIKQLKEYIGSNYMHSLEEKKEILDSKWNEAHTYEEFEDDYEDEKEKRESKKHYNMIEEGLKLCNFKLTIEDMFTVLNHYINYKENELLAFNEREIIDNILSVDGISSFDKSYSIILDNYSISKKIKYLVPTKVINEECKIRILNLLDMLEIKYKIDTRQGSDIFFLLKKQKLNEIEKMLKSISLLIDIYDIYGIRFLDHKAADKFFDPIILEISQSNFYLNNERIEVIDRMIIRLIVTIIRIGINKILQDENQVKQALRDSIFKTLKENVFYNSTPKYNISSNNNEEEKLYEKLQLEFPLIPKEELYKLAVVGKEIFYFIIRNSNQDKNKLKKEANNYYLKYLYTLALTNPTTELYNKIKNELIVNLIKVSKDKESDEMINTPYYLFIRLLNLSYILLEVFLTTNYITPVYGRDIILEKIKKKDEEELNDSGISCDSEIKVEYPDFLIYLTFELKKTFPNYHLFRVIRELFISLIDCFLVDSDDKSKLYNSLRTGITCENKSLFLEYILNNQNFNNKILCEYSLNDNKNSDDENCNNDLFNKVKEINEDNKGLFKFDNLKPIRKVGIARGIKKFMDLDLQQAMIDASLCFSIENKEMNDLIDEYQF